MAARTLGWTQRRFGNVVTNTIVQASIDTSHNPVNTTERDASGLTATDVAGWEMQAGVSVSIRWGGIIPAGVGAAAANTQTWTLEVFYDTGATVVTGWTDTRTNTTGATTADYTTTFTPTVSGTMRIRVRYRSVVTVGGAVISDFTTDSGNFGDTNTVGGSSNSALDVFTPGLIRVGTTISAFSVTGASGSPAAYPDVLTANMTRGHAPGSAEAAFTNVVSWRKPDNTQFTTSTFASSTATTVAASTVTVNNVFPVASTLVKLVLTPSNSALSTFSGGTGLPWVHWSSVPSTPGTVTTTLSASGKIVGVTFTGVLTADPRLTIQKYMQLNSTTINTPPDGVSNTLFNVMAKLAADVGEVTHRVKNALGAGVNGVSFNAPTLSDLNGLVAPRTRPGTTHTTATLGGAAGWLVSSGGLGGANPNFVAWPDSLPSGQWYYNYAISSPATAIGLETPASPQTFTLLAPNPAYKLLVIGKPFGAGEQDHFHAGDILIVAFVFNNTLTHQLFKPLNPKIGLRRFNAGTGMYEYLKADFTWDVAAGATMFVFDTTTTPAVTLQADGVTYAITLTEVQTAGWGTRDLEVVCTGEDGSGTPYSDIIQVVNVSTNNRHSGYAFDPIGLFK